MSRFAGLPSAIAAKAKTMTPDDDEPEDEEDCESEGKGKKKEPKMTDTEQAAAVAAAKEAGIKEATDRFNAVLASEHYQGREALAHKMLSKGAMSAEDIIDVLAAAPKATPTAADDAAASQAAEEAAREEMRAELAKGKNSNIDAGAGDKPDAKAAADASWDRAVAKANKLAGYTD